MSEVSETALAALYWRAMESQRPDALMKDENAVKLVTMMGYDFNWIRQIKMNEMLKVTRIMLTREMDRYARDFLTRHPDGVVVHIGCGLDARFDRVDNGKVEWYDLDVPEIIELRRKLIGGQRDRYHLLPCSALDYAWMDKVNSRRPVLFVAETVFVYFTDAQVRELFQTMRDHFPGAEVVFDAWKPYELWIANRRLSPTKIAELMQWGISRTQKIEAWAEGIHLLDEWGFFDKPEPRLKSWRWLGPLFRWLKPIRVLHFQLGRY